MRSSLRFLFPAALLLCLAGPASAQYLKITTDNPTDNTRLRASGTTVLTISLDTNHDRGGATQTCNSHTLACGNVGTANPLDLGAYTITLSAVGGTVTWGAYSSAIAAYTDLGSSPATSSQVEINFGRASGFDPAGLYTLGSIPVTPASGTPSIVFARGAQPINPFGFGTGFGTECDGFNFPNTYVLADPADLCNTGDFTDADGAAAAAQPNTQPVISAPASTTVAEGSTFSISATGTDPDAGQTLSISVTGLPPDLTQPIRTGPSPLTVVVSGTPGFNDAGTYNVQFTVTDGAGGSASATTILTITNTNRLPTLNPIANMTVCGSTTADQAVSGSDPDGDALTFTKVAGPTYMTVMTTSATTGNIHLAPGISEPVGTTGATVRASDGSGGTADRSLTLTVPACDFPPTLNQPANMTVNEGATADQTLTATDPNGAPLTFEKVAGPTFMTVTTTTPGNGTATGNIHLAPGFSDSGTYAATVRARNGGFTNDKTFMITVNNVNRAPNLAQPANMSVSQGSTADQALSATDPDGNAVTFSKVSGPTYVTVTTTSPGTGTAAGNVHVAAGFSDTGSATVTVRTTDNGSPSLFDEKSFTVTVLCTGAAPSLSQPANMTVNEGATADQTLNASDADGSPMIFSKVSGPTFVTVTTTSPGTGTATGNVHLAPGFSDAGTSSTVIRVSSGGGCPGSSDKSFTTVVNNVNRPPTLVQPNNVTVNEGSTADVLVSASDPDNDPLTFSFGGCGGFSVFDPVTRIIHIAPGFNDAGTYSCTITVSDGQASVSKTLTITVLNVNRAPTLNPIANMSTFEGGGCRDDQVITGSDPDGDALTFFKAAGPAFMTVTTTSPTTGNIHLAAGFSDAGAYSATVSASDGFLSDSKTFTITVNNANRAPTLAQPGNMTVVEGATADQTITGSDPDGCPVTFSKVSGPIYVTVTTTSPGSGTGTGNIHLAPGFSDFGTASATVRVSDGALFNDKSFTITVTLCNCTVRLDQPADMTVTEGMTADQRITAVDPEGDTITFSKVSGPVFMTVSTISPGTGNIHLAPGLADAGTYTALVRATNGTGLSDSKSLAITVLTSGNHCPAANPGGPYSSIAGVPVDFDGSASSDPDGNPLMYAWDFDASDGIQVDAVGATVTHIFVAAGTFTVTLTVTDNGDGDPAQICSNSATTTPTIAEVCPATVFNGYDTIRLGSGKPYWFGYVQPTSSCYSNTDVVTSSFAMKYSGRQISVAPSKTTVGGDKSGDGIQEIKVSFTKDDLRTLFAGTGLANGHNMVTVVIEANLVTGGKLSGSTQLDVVNNGNFTISEVRPNPLNPSATLTYTTTLKGAVRIDMFDIQGRLVRRLVDDPAMAAGVHQTTIDGRGQRGEKLSSGVYYIRGVSSEGVFQHLVTILK